MKNPWIVIGVFVVLLFGGAFYIANQAQESNNAGIEVTTHVKGNPEASVVLEEFSDFQCGACGTAYPFVKELVTEYEEELRFEYRHFPIEQAHPYALQAAMAAEAAGQQGQFYEFHDLLFENQQVWSQTATPNVLFQEYAEQLGLDIDQFKRQSSASLLRDKARSDRAEGVERGVTGTPTFFLNGEIMRNPDGSNFSYAEIAARVAAAIDPEAAALEQSEDPEVVGETTGEAVRFGI